MLVTNRDNGQSILPMECPYLNRAALLATIGAQPAPAKHFTLRRKPKSAALKAELFQKGREVEVQSLLNAIRWLFNL